MNNSSARPTQRILAMIVISSLFFRRFEFELSHQGFKIKGVETILAAGLEDDGVEAGENFGPFEANETVGAGALVGFVDHALLFGFGEGNDTVSFSSLFAA